MTLITVDVVLDLPAALREQALAASAVLVERVRRHGQASRFRLGQPFPDGLERDVCEPHVSLFMLQVDDSELDAVRAALDTVASGTPAVAAVGQEYRHNPFGAPELYFRTSAQWRGLQRAVVAAVEPLRRGRLREVDPAGERIVDVIEHLRREDPHGARLQQLVDYGYDEIADHRSDRFNPHVTLAWPAAPCFVDLAGLPEPEKFSGVLSQLALYKMNGSGTCTTRYQTCLLKGPRE